MISVPLIEAAFKRCKFDSQKNQVLMLIISIEKFQDVESAISDVIFI